MRRQIDEFTDYLRNVKKTSENTLISYKRDLLRMAEFMGENGISEASDVTVDKLSAYAASLREEHFAASSITRHYTSIKTFFRYLVENGNINDNPSETLKAPRIEKSEPRILSTVEIEELFSQKFKDDAKGKRDKAILELLYATGLKSSEITDLRLENIDLSISCLRLGDENSSRLIPYGRKAKEALSDYLTGARNELLGENTDDDTVFLNCSGTHMSRQGLWKLIKTYVKKAGIKQDITPFSLRHSFAVHLVENGADLDSVQEMMGFADVNTISKYLSKKHKSKDPFEWARLRN
ncbi:MULTISPECIES: tyrosine-type recombinase/integrase [unclassified Butyrivibrio]|uniref:tyrosine-type recombinase/integrase n=1 Tax=unclassified Butyrivibrio TaxID=2639466 RepID=UPI0003B5060A|nr:MULTISPECIES: tyrosine-type recombinase/integrase [unclassified Butyrivibrio]MDC7295448.1 tyrosine-type recombinase/integrase [Butyrivibrio sp. DSM 10294]